ncbi:MAG: ABC transporter substrate-binding protein [Dehalococcoidia bacterium]
MQRHGLPELHHELSRRDFLRGAAGAGLAGAGVVLLGGCGSDEGNGSLTSTPEAVAHPPPETTTIRLPKEIIFVPWTAPLRLAEQFLPAEGFTNVQYIAVPVEISDIRHLAAGEIDIGVPDAASVTVAADRGDPLVVLAGVHNSPFVLFGNERVQSLRDLKGKRIWVLKRDATDRTYALMAALLAYVGIDVQREVEFVELSPAEGATQQMAGTIDAWLAVRPYSTALRNANIGHVILDGAMDPPWAHYFFAMATGNRSFVEKHPVAAKRALRAILKAADVCAQEPERAARYLVDQGLTPLTYDQTLAAITGVSFAAWREFNPEDTMRFYALRLKEAGLVTSTPDELIARATDWRYLDEIKRELGVA